MRSGVRSPWKSSSICIAGAWSHCARQTMGRNVKRPSGVVSPRPIAEARGDVVAHLLVGHDVAAVAVADQDHVPSDGAAEEHVGEGRPRVELVDRDAEKGADVGQGLVGQVAAVALHDAHRPGRRRAAVRVVVQRRLDLACVRRRSACCPHRSTSAITKSMLPRIVMRSGISKCSAMRGSTCRCGNDGVRMRLR